MLRRFASLSGRRPVSSRCLQVESLESRSMLSLSAVVAPEVSVPAVAALESQDLSTDSSVATAQIAPLPASSFTLVGPVDQPAANTTLAAPLPSVTPALADAALATTELSTDGVEANALDLSDSFVVPFHTGDINLPPSVDSFVPTYNNLFGIWTLEGRVSDPDDSLVGMTVTFGGVFANYNLSTTVNADNTYSLQWMSDERPEGFGSATVTDPHGATGMYETWVSS